MQYERETSRTYLLTEKKKKNTSYALKGKEDYIFKTNCYT